MRGFLVVSMSDERGKTSASRTVHRFGKKRDVPGRGRSRLRACVPARQCDTSQHTSESIEKKMRAEKAEEYARR